MGPRRRTVNSTHRAATRPAALAAARGHAQPSALDRGASPGARPEAAQQFHAQLRASLLAGAQLTAPTIVKALRVAYVELGRDRRDPFGDALPAARALASIYAAWMETLDPQSPTSDVRSLKHLSDAGWIEAQMLVSGQAGLAAADRRTLLKRGAVEAVDFVIGDGSRVPQRNDLAWLSGFAAGLQARPTGERDGDGPAG